MFRKGIHYMSLHWTAFLSKKNLLASNRKTKMALYLWEQMDNSNYANLFILYLIFKNHWAWGHSCLLILKKTDFFFSPRKGKKENRSVHTFPLNNSISPLSYRMMTLLVHFSPVKPQPSFEISIRNVPESSLQKSYQAKKMNEPLM